MSQELEVLRAARDLIADPDRWTQGTYARAARGYPVPPLHPDACRWCALGAITKVTANTGAEPGTAAGIVDALYEIGSGGKHIVTVNDDEGHAAVLALFDKALAA